MSPTTLPRQTPAGPYIPIGEHNQTISRVNHLQKLIPLTKIHRDSEQREIQLWNSEKYGLIGSVFYPGGELKIIPGTQIKNPLAPADNSKKLLEKLELCAPKMWDLAFDVQRSTITIFPHLIAAAGDGQEGLKFYHGFNPFAKRNLRETIAKLKGCNKLEERNAYTGPDRKFARYRLDANGNKVKVSEYYLDLSDEGRFQGPGHPDHVDVWVKGVGKHRLPIGNKREGGPRGDDDPDHPPNGGGGGGKPGGGPPSGGGSPAQKQFQQTLQQTKLTDTYNASHPNNPVAAKGGRGGEIGGVASSTEYLEGLFDDPEFLLASENFFVFPNLPEGRMPFSDLELSQILRELAIGVYVHSTVPFFSLHFNQDLDQFPVIHPAYENTLVGRVIAMLDYIMKGYLNGGVFEEDFIDAWYKDPNWDRKKGTSLQKLIDFAEYCERELEGTDKCYRSFGDLKEIMESMGEISQRLRGLGVLNPKELEGLQRAAEEAEKAALEPEALRDFSQFRNSFRIISKLNSVQKEGNVLLFDTGFDVGYTIQPSPAYQETLDQHIRQHGRIPRSYEVLLQATEVMSKQIHDHMVKLPLCRDYFSMLMVITSIASYFSTLKKHRKIPILPHMEMHTEKGCPPLFPHLPIKIPTREELKFSPRQVYLKVKNHPLYPLQNYLAQLIAHLKLRKSFAGIDNVSPELKRAVRNVYNTALKENLLEFCSPPLRRYFRDKMDDIESELEEQGGQFVACILNSLRLSVGGHLEQMDRVDEDKFQTGFLEALEEALPNEGRPIGEVQYRIQRVASEVLPKEMRTINSMVGGCGLRLESTKVTSSIQASAFVRENWSKIVTLVPETWEQVAAQNQSSNRGAIFRLQFEDLPVEFDEDYTWMESCLLTKETPEQLKKSLEIQSALLSDDKEAFGRLIASGNGLAQIRDRSLRSLVHIAAQKKDPYYVNALKNKGLPLSVEDVHGYRPIHYAAMNGAVETLKCFAADLEAKSHNRSTPLIVAIQHEQLEAIRYLMGAGATLTKIAGGYNALHCALHTGNKEIIDAVLTHRAASRHVNELSEEGGTPLMLACELDSVSLLAKLIEMGADPAAKRRDGVTAIEIAILRNCASVLKYLLERAPLTAHAIERGMKESSVEIVALMEKRAGFYQHKNACQDTALHTAIRNGNIPAADYLIEACRDRHYLDAQNIEKQTAFSLSASLGLWELVKALIKKGVSYRWASLLNMPYDPYLKTLFSREEFTGEQIQECLLMAAKRGNYEAITHVLEPKEADLLGFVGPNGWTLLHYMAKADGIYLFKKLLPSETNFLHRLPEEGNKTLAYLAAENRSFRVLGFLITQMNKSGISFANHYRDRHLFYAVLESQNLDACKQMLKMYGDLHNEKLDENGTRPAHLAARYGSVEILKELAKRGADLNSEDKAWWTPLTYAVSAGAEDVLEFLLKKVPVTPKALYTAASLDDEKGYQLLCRQKPEEKSAQSALIHAIRGRNTQAFMRLRSLLTSLDFQTPDGWTPLLLASLSGQQEILGEILAQTGKEESTKDGNNALHIAALRGHTHCVSLLLKAGYQNSENEQGKKASQLAGHRRGISQLFSPLEEIRYMNCVAVFWGAAQRESREELAAAFHNLPLNETIFIPEIKYWGTPLQVLLFIGKGQVFATLIHGALQDENLNPNVLDCKGNTLGHLLAKERISPKEVDKIDVVTKNFEGQTPLHFAAAHASPSFLEEFLKMLTDLVGKDQLNPRDNKGATPIFGAIEQNKEKNIPLLIEYGADLSCTNHALETPLIDALTRRNYEIVKLLLANGADPNQPGTLRGLFPLHIAIGIGHGSELVNTLLQHGADCASRTKGGQDAAHFAAAAGNLSLLRLVSAKGLSLSNRDEEGLQPLHRASVMGKGETLAALATLEGSSVNTPIDLTESKKAIEHGATPLQLAALHGKTEVVEQILGLRGDPEAKTKQGRSSLCFAAMSPAAKANLGILFRYKLSKDADTLLEAANYAIQQDNLDALRILCDRGIAVDAELTKGATGLHIASITGALQCTKWLLQKGADPLRPCAMGQSALELSAANDNYEQFQAVLNGIEGVIGFQNEKGETLLHIAARAGKLSHVLLLLLCGSSPEVCNAQGYTPLHLAAKEGCDKIVRLLLVCGLDTRQAAPDGKRAMDLAIDPRTKHAFQEFEQMRTSLKEGDTGLHVAVRYKNPLAVLLLAQLEDVNAQNEEGETPMHVALQLNQPEIVRHLERYGAAR